MLKKLKKVQDDSDSTEIVLKCFNFYPFKILLSASQFVKRHSALGVRDKIDLMEINA